MAFPDHQVPPPPPPDWPEPSPPPFTQPGQPPGFYPLTIGRTVSLALNMYRFGWRTFVAISLLAGIPVALLQSLLAYATYQDIAKLQERLLNGLESPSPTVPSVTNSLANFPWQTIGLTLAVSLLLGAITFIGSGALIHAVVTAMKGGRLSTRASYTAAFGRLKDLLLLYVAVTAIGLALTIIVVLGPLLSIGSAGLLGNGGPIAFLALLVGVAIVFVSVFLAIRLTFTLQTLMIEDASAIPALGRSYRLIAGSMWRVVGYTLMFGLILGLIGFVISLFSFTIGLFFSPINLSTPGLIVNPVATAAQSLTTNLLAEVFSPILTIGMVFLYFDIRWRHGETVPVPGGGETTGPAMRGPG